MVKPQQVTSQEKSKGDSNPNALQPKKKSSAVLIQASANDIYTAIVNPQLSNITLTARPDEIVKAISQSEISEIIVKDIANEKNDEQQVSISAITSATIPGRYIDTNYFKAANSGYVIQIAGFSNEDRLASFLSEYNELSIYAYRRLLNNEKFVIITSQIYSEKAKAKAAIEQLPLSLQENDVWIKSITAINTEINVFESSQ
jgi:DamX protein